MIRSFLAMLAALAPIAALAQYSPPAQQDPQAAPPPAQPPAQYPPPSAPPQAAPPAYPWQQQPPPQYPMPQRRPQQRDSWYIGFGFGGGDGSAVIQGQSYNFKDLNNGASPTTGFFEFEAGATLTPQLLLGGEIAGILSEASGGGLDTSVSIANLNLVATFFPMEKGLFVKGGIGRAALSWQAPLTTGGTGTFDTSGFDVTAGVGYAFWLGRSFNLKLALDYSHQWYGSSDVLPESSNFWAAYLGLVWY